MICPNLNKEILHKGWDKMNRRFISVLLLSFFLLTLLTSCTFADADVDFSTAGQLAKNSLKPDERILYLTEDGRYTPYYIVSAYNNDFSLLLRKDILSTDLSFSSDGNGYYAESPIDLYLNSDFLNLFPDSVNNLIQDTDIKISCRFPDTDNIEEIKRKVFLLSASEVGIDVDFVNNEGSRLDFFNDLDNRLAFKDDKPYGWWLRSAYIIDRGLAWHIAADGTVHGSAVQIPSGIRPAFCIPSSTPIVKDNNLMGYVLD